MLILLDATALLSDPLCTGTAWRVIAHAAGCGGFVRHRLLASSDTAGHVSVPRMLVCVDTASAPDGCQVVRCFVAWARR